MKQGELLETPVDDKATYEVLEIRWHNFGNFGRPNRWPIYVHTRPIGWIGPEVSEKLPWEE